MAVILVVDDDFAIRRFVESVLAQEDHFVICACDGKEGLKVVNQAKFDLVITDLIMPGTEGIEMIRQIRKTQPSLKIIAMTAGGFGDPSDYLALAKGFGAAKTLVKPFTRELLLAAVSDSLS